jgi:hypothetical protein
MLQHSASTGLLSKIFSNFTSVIKPMGRPSSIQIKKKFCFCRAFVDLAEMTLSVAFIKNKL